MKGYLLDTNYLIYLVDSNTSSSKKRGSITRFSIKT